MHKDLYRALAATRSMIPTSTGAAGINDALRAARNGGLKGMGHTGAALVSPDFNHDLHSSVFSTDQIKVMEGNMCCIQSWYDNEWGFSNRMIETAIAMGGRRA